MFFLVAGYASADFLGALARRRGDVAADLASAAAGAGCSDRPRCTSHCVSAVVVALDVAGVAGSVLEYAGWAVAMHLWFLAVYVIVVSLTPIAMAAQRRWGLAGPAALGIGVVLVDVASLGYGVPYLGWLNYLLCWGTFYQLGIAWYGGLLSGRRAALLAVAAAVTLGLLSGSGPIPSA